MTEWKHRGSDFFSFKTKQVTIDFWDFSGDPNYHIIYSCFKCSPSLHLVVCAANVFDRQDLLRWLTNIQATSAERIPVVIVFTHCDKFSSREQKDTFRKDVIRWLTAWERCVLKGHAHSFPTIQQSIKNLNGDEISSSLESQQTKDASTPDDQESSSSEDLPLLPIVHRIFFVNALTGDGVSALRKCLIKIASGSLSQELTGFSGFQLIGREIPSVYHQVEMMVRALREKFRNSRREGEQRPFYTVSELIDKKLKRPLSESGIELREFEAALNFLHEVCVCECMSVCVMEKFLILSLQLSLSLPILLSFSYHCPPLPLSLSLTPSLSLSPSLPLSLSPPLPLSLYPSHPLSLPFLLPSLPVWLCVSS